MATVETPQITNGTHGQTICVPATWIDVATFIGLNYVTHAFTVVLPPGAALQSRIMHALSSLFMPIVTTGIALGVITGFVRLQWQQRRRLNRPSPLFVAAHNGALRIVIGFDKHGIAQVPTAFSGRRHADFAPVYMDYGDSETIHGQLPCIQRRHPMPDRVPESATDDLRYYCFMLPPGWRPTVDALDEAGNVELARQHNVLQGLAAVVQMIFACKELYNARGRQIERYGYAAFGLTVVPYLWMSFLNLLGNICQPQYSHKYIVYYRGIHGPNPAPLDEPLTMPSDDQSLADKVLEAKILGAVGFVYGNPDDFSTPAEGYTVVWPNTLQRAGIWVGVCLSLILPYFIIYALTDFEKGRSTTIQRLSVVGWLAYGQFTALYAYIATRQHNKFQNAGWVILGLCLAFIALVASVLSVVVVSKMILENGVCVSL